MSSTDRCGYRGNVAIIRAVRVGRRSSPLLSSPGASLTFRRQFVATGYTELRSLQGRDSSRNSSRRETITTRYRLPVSGVRPGVRMRAIRRKVPVITVRVGDLLASRWAHRPRPERPCRPIRGGCESGTGIRRRRWRSVGGSLLLSWN